MFTKTETYGLTIVGGIIAFAVVLLAALFGFQASAVVAFPIAGVVGIIVSAGTFVWAQSTTDRPDPLLG